MTTLPTSQLWPPVVDPPTLTSWVTDSTTAKGIPGFARGLQLYAGLLGQCLLDQVRNGQATTPRPRMLQQPDVALSRPNFIGQSVEDWWVHGNTLSLVVARDSRNQPAAVRYFPTYAWNMLDSDPDAYYLHGRRVPAADVIHVQRGVDPLNPRRGIGVVEQHLRSLKRVGLQERYEESALEKGGVPSVAVIAPNQNLTETEADAAATKWEEKFDGPVRRPVVLPNGTQVETLSWNPADQELVLARQVSLTDMANMMNLDPYFLGAPGSSHTYKSPGGMFVALLRTSLEPVMAPFEDVWGRAWLPYGSDLRFDRQYLTRDDMSTMVTWGRGAVDGGLMTVNEWRLAAGLPRLDDEAADQLRPAKQQQSTDTDSTPTETEPGLQIVPAGTTQEEAS